MNLDIFGEAKVKIQEILDEIDEQREAILKTHFRRVDEDTADDIVDYCDNITSYLEDAISECESAEDSVDSLEGDY